MEGQAEWRNGRAGWAGRAHQQRKKEDGEKQGEVGLYVDAQRREGGQVQEDGTTKPPDVHRVEVYVPAATHDPPLTH